MCLFVSLYIRAGFPFRFFLSKKLDELHVKINTYSYINAIFHHHNGHRQRNYLFSKQLRDCFSIVQHYLAKKVFLGRNKKSTSV